MTILELDFEMQRRQRRLSNSQALQINWVRVSQIVSGFVLITALFLAFR